MTPLHVYLIIVFLLENNMWGLGCYTPPIISLTYLSHLNFFLCVVMYVLITLAIILNLI